MAAFARGADRARHRQRHAIRAAAEPEGEMVAVAGIAGFLAGLAISEYYNRRIQKLIVGMREARRAPRTQRPPEAGPYTQDDMRLMRAGYRVGRRVGGEHAGRDHAGDQ